MQNNIGNESADEIGVGNAGIEQRRIEDEDIRNSEIAFPDLSQYNNLEVFTYIGEEGDSLYNEMWKEVKSI